MHEDQFWDIVGLMLNNEASPAQLEQLDEHLRKHPELRKKFLLMHAIWNTREEEQTDLPAAFARHMQRLNTHLASPVRTDDVSPQNSRSRGIRKLIWIPAAAAALVIVFGSVALFKSGSRHQTASVNTVSTKPGSRSRIQLPDGTTVWLNADSRLDYEEDPGGATRNVHLSGEAYFDVVRNKERPFIIHTAAIDIRVLGTAFNVRSYENEKNTETSLFRGSVEVIPHNDPERRIILKPLEKLIVQNSREPAGRVASMPTPDPGDDKPLMSISSVHVEPNDSTAKEILWTRNKLSFNSESLEEVALKIERWFDVKVTITDARLKSKRYTAVFDYENLNQVMEALRITGNFTYTIRKKEVVISP